MGQLICRGVRGAITVANNTADDILDATRELLIAIIKANAIEKDYVASVIFSTTPDLNAVFPAVAARELGWTDIPLICTHEMSVPGALPRAVRILIHLNTDKKPGELYHPYLRDARRLRPDLPEPSGGWVTTLDQ